MPIPQVTIIYHFCFWFQVSCCTRNILETFLEAAFPVYFPLHMCLLQLSTDSPRSFLLRHGTYVGCGCLWTRVCRLKNAAIQLFLRMQRGWSTAETFPFPGSLLLSFSVCCRKRDFLMCLNLFRSYLVAVHGDGQRLDYPLSFQEPKTACRLTVDTTRCYHRFLKNYFILG